MPVIWPPPWVIAGWTLGVSKPSETCATQDLAPLCVKGEDTLDGLHVIVAVARSQRVTARRIRVTSTRLSLSGGQGAWLARGWLIRSLEKHLQTVAVSGTKRATELEVVGLTGRDGSRDRKGRC